MKDLQAEARRLNADIKLQEEVLRLHLKKLPRETMKLGIGNVASSVISSRAAGLALTAGTSLLGSYFLPKTATSAAGIIGSSLKKAGMLKLGQMALKWVFKKRNKAG